MRGPGPVMAALASGIGHGQGDAISWGPAHVLVAGGFALVYAPFMEIVISTLCRNRWGGNRVLNLMTSIGPSLLITLYRQDDVCQETGYGPSLVKGNAGFTATSLWCSRWCCWLYYYFENEKAVI